MKVKATFLFVILFMVCSLAIAHADEVSHRAAAEELLLLTNPDDMAKQFLNQFGDMLDLQFQKMGAPEDLRPIFKKYTDKMFKLIEEECRFDNIKHDLITIYVNTYTEYEIRAITAFYKTPVGKKFMEKMPRLMQESMSIAQKKMQEMIPKIQKISQEMAEEIKRLKAQKEG